MVINEPDVRPVPGPTGRAGRLGLDNRGFNCIIGIIIFSLDAALTTELLTNVTNVNILISYSATIVDDVVPYVDIPKPQRKKSERKPYPTPMKILIQRAKEERTVRKVNPSHLVASPDNGLLIPELINVAFRVNQAKESLLRGLSKLVGIVVPVWVADEPLNEIVLGDWIRYCSEVHIGSVGHEIRTCTGPNNSIRSSTHDWRIGGVADVVNFPYCYHLHDRVGNPRVVHDERFQVKRLPAILELCIQAGLDHHDYPTKRRTKPVYSFEGRIVDFELETEGREATLIDKEQLLPSIQFHSESQLWFEDQNLPTELVSMKTLESWFEMRSGVELLMKTYSVKTCGYCPEVQVGPKGHKVRMCKAARHQFRSGLHAWQEATVDDVIWPNYVWHVDGPMTLANEVKRYYGKAPSVVELCVQAGAPVPDQCRSMMRLDVVCPSRDEVDLVA
ncbi:hypothetical protein ACLOJK_013253 [Asimina triloba]